MPSEFITFDYLKSFAGMVFVLMVVVQFTKSLIKQAFSDQAVRVYAFGWALAFNFVLGWYQGQLDVAGREITVVILLMLLNSIIVTMAAIGGYELVTDPGASKTKSGSG